MLKTVTINGVELQVDYEEFVVDNSCYGEEVEYRIYKIFLEEIDITTLLNLWVFDEAERLLSE